MGSCIHWGRRKFLIAITRNRAGWYLRPRFSISLHIDDTPLLEEMEHLFNRHNIKTILQTNKPHNNQRSHQTILTVRAVEQCSKLSNLFKDMKWHSKKHKDFLIWEYALTLFEQIKKETGRGHNRKWTDQRIYDMVYLRSFMNVTKKKPRALRNQEKILSWDLSPSPHILNFLDILVNN